MSASSSDANKPALLPTVVRGIVLSAAVAVIWTVVVGGATISNSAIIAISIAYAAFLGLIAGVAAGSANALVLRSLRYSSSDWRRRLFALIAAASLGVGLIYLVPFALNTALPPVVFIGVPGLILGAIEWLLDRRRRRRRRDRPKVPTVKRSGRTALIAAASAVVGAVIVVAVTWWILPLDWTGETLVDLFERLSDDGRIRIQIATFALAGITATPAILAHLAASDGKRRLQQLGWGAFALCFTIVSLCWYQGRVSEALREVIGPVELPVTYPIDLALLVAAWIGLLIAGIVSAIEYMRFGPPTNSHEAPETLPRH